jgi:lipocalin-like protein
MTKTKLQTVAFSLVLIALTAFLLEHSVSGSPKGESDQQKLEGAWRLVSVEDQGPDGKMVKQERTAILMYSHDGHMSVQIMAPTAHSEPETGPIHYEKDGYEAYFGTYRVDAATHTVTHHVEGALVRSLIGQDLGRVYQFSGRQLVLKSSRPDEHWVIVWERY